MHIEFETGGAALVARISGKLDRATAPELERSIDARLADGPPCIVLDLAGLEYVSSAGLRILLLLGKKARAAGGGLAFCRLQGMVRELFAMAYFDTMFPTANTPEQAAAMLLQDQTPDTAT